MRRYIALIHADSEHGLTVTLPDFPGVVVAAARLDQAREQITAALAAHIEGLEARGQRLPAPSSFDALMADPSHRDGAAIVVFVRGEQSTPEAPRSNSNDEWPEADA